MDRGLCNCRRQPSDWDFGAGEFTIKSFIRLTTGRTQNWCVAAQWSSTAASAAWGLYNDAGTTFFRFYDSTTTLRSVSVVATFNADTWYHLAVDRDSSGKIRIYKDGVMLVGTTFAQTFQNSTNPLRIGSIQTLQLLILQATLTSYA